LRSRFVVCLSTAEVRADPEPHLPAMDTFPARRNTRLFALDELGGGHLLGTAVFSLRVHSSLLSAGNPARQSRRRLDGQSPHARPSGRFSLGGIERDDLPSQDSFGGILWSIRASIMSLCSRIQPVMAAISQGVAADDQRVESRNLLRSGLRRA